MIHLANYLASWGMYRGSGGLLQKSYQIHGEALKILMHKDYVPLICENGIEMSKEKIDLLMQLKNKLSSYYESIVYEQMGSFDNISTTDTLISKILLGTFSCIPAYDQFFVEGLKMSGVGGIKFNNNGIEVLFDWYEKNGLHKVVSCLNEGIKKYPLMKLLDMYFWSLGYNMAIIEKK